MRALEVKGPGIVEVVERPDPTPGAGQILVRMKASTLNFRDVATIRFGGGGGASPFVPLSDGAGVVEGVGPGVTRWQEGDRVTTLFYGPHWQGGRPASDVYPNSLGQPATDGCGQELLVIDQDGVVATPEAMTDAESAALSCAGVTAWRALTVNATVAAGDVALLQGTGGVSISGLQIAHAMGLETIITSSSDEKLARAKSLGADHVINYKTQPEWGSVAFGLTGGRGVNVILEVGGNNTIEQSMRCLALDGDLCCIGMVANDDWTAPPALTLGVADLIPKARHIHGSMVGSREDQEGLMRLCALRDIKPVIDRTFAWTEIGAALDANASGQFFGKIALTF